MDKPKTSGPDKNPTIDAGEVPDKQLHRWKDEGGALPPEPESEPETGSEGDPESGPATRPGG